MSRRSENTSFACIHCAAEVTAHRDGSYRNHCPQCLWSQHRDTVPGDRLSRCHGPMEPIGVDYSGKKGYILIHRCTSCAVIDRNKLAPDDDLDAMVNIQRPR